MHSLYIGRILDRNQFMERLKGLRCNGYKVSSFTNLSMEVITHNDNNPHMIRTLFVLSVHCETQ